MHSGQQDINGRMTPVFAAAMRANCPMIRLLLSWHARVEDALVGAAQGNKLEAMEVILSVAHDALTAHVLSSALKRALWVEAYDVAALLQLHLCRVVTESGGDPAAVLASVHSSPEVAWHLRPAAVTTALLRGWDAATAKVVGSSSSLVAAEQQQAAVLVGAHQLLLAMRVDRLAGTRKLQHMQLPRARFLLSAVCVVLLLGLSSCSRTGSSSSSMHWLTPAQ